MIEVSYFTCVFLVVRFFCGVKVKAMCQGQGQISKSHFSQKTLTLAVTFEW